MTWTVSRNNHISEAAATDRTIQTVCLIKDLLKAATTPWTVVGSGSGTGGSYNMVGTDLLPTFPSVSGVADFCWICLQNTDGLQVVLQVNGSSMYFWWSGNGGYESAGDESEVLRPGNTSPPTKEIDMNTGGTTLINVAQSTTHYKSVAIEDSGHSFVMFGKYGSSAAFHTSLLKCSVDPSDTDPYVAIHWNINSDNPWDMDTLEGAGDPETRQLYHPTGGQQNMACVDYYSNAMDVFDSTLQTNPYSSKTQLGAIVMWCPTVSYRFVKGILNSMYRVPENKSMGDTFESGELINMYSVAVPWGSAVDTLQ